MASYDVGASGPLAWLQSINAMIVRVALKAIASLVSWMPGRLPPRKSSAHCSKA